MGRKKRGHPDVEELLARPWCYYCERDFEDLKLLISHQKAKHFKCDRCGRRLNTAGGLSVHMNQVHKESLTSVENALPNRQGLEVEIFGIEGIPEEVAQQHNQRIIQNFYQAQAERYAATGNPPPGQHGGGGQGPAKKLKTETPDDIKRRLAEHRARVQAIKAAGGNVQQVQAAVYAAPPPYHNRANYPPTSASPASNLPARPGAPAAALPSALPARPGQPGYPGYGASTVDELVSSAGRQQQQQQTGDDIDHIIRMAEAGIRPGGETAEASTRPGEEAAGVRPGGEAPAGGEKKSKKDKDKNVRMIYDDDVSPEERMAGMARYAFAPTAA